MAEKQSMNFLVARAEKHMWEEPVLSGINGSGTIFFSGCKMHCVYCQNYEISHNGKGLKVTENQLIYLMLSLQDKGVHNINLVSPSHYALPLSRILEKAKKRLTIPVVYNSSCYDKLDYLKRLDGLVDIYLPDLKYVESAISQKYSGIADYFSVASEALKEMRRQQPKDIFQNRLLKQGVIVRHLVLPANTDDSIKVLDFLAKTDKSFYVSVMAQYFPTAKAANYPEINRRLTQEEYEAVCSRFFDSGLSNGFMQGLDSAIEDYVPDFDLDKLKAEMIKAEKKFGLTS